MPCSVSVRRVRVGMVESKISSLHAVFRPFRQAGGIRRKDMNPYEERQEEKREGLRAGAVKRRAESNRLYKSGHGTLAQIPFGQPILVGHHSKNADRAYWS